MADDDEPGSFNRLFWNEKDRLLVRRHRTAATAGSLRSAPTRSWLSACPTACCRPSVRGAVVEKVREHLLTPYGLRTLAPSDPQYRGRYTGGPVERDGAYHQGTVWPWLMGPFITAYMKVNGSQRGRPPAGRGMARAP